MFLNIWVYVKIFETRYFSRQTYKQVSSFILNIYGKPQAISTHIHQND